MDDPDNNGGFTPSDPNQGGMGGDQPQAPVADPNAVPETPVSEPAPEQQPQPEVPPRPQHHRPLHGLRTGASVRSKDCRSR